MPKRLVRFAVNTWNLVLKYALIVTIAMAVTLVAVTANIAYYGYLQLSSQLSASVQRFFQRFVHEELREHFAELEGKLEQVDKDLRQLKEVVEEQTEAQKTATEEMNRRFETLRETIAGTNILLEQMSRRETAFIERRMISGDLELPMTPPHSSNAMHGILNPSGNGFNSSEESIPLLESPLTNPTSNRLGSVNSFTSTPSPIPPPPPMPNFTYGKASFKTTPLKPKSTLSISSALSTTKPKGIAVSLNEIKEMRQRLKKVSEN